MRIRRKKWAVPELEASNIFVKDNSKYKGKIREIFNNDNPIYLELGCGRGLFAGQFGVSNKNVNIIAIDIKSDILGYAKRNIESLYKEKNEETNNIALMAMNIEQILNIFTEKELIDRIYINFCNPWPKPRHNKRRLTHSKQLELYKNFLKSNGEIYFKTDDDNLFNSSLKYFEESGFKIEKCTYDLEKENIFRENYVTEHEQMYMEKGVKIKALIAVWRK